MEEQGKTEAARVFTDSVSDWLIPYEDLQLQKELGSGSFKTVFEATYLNTTVVAVAKFKAQLDAAAIAEMEKEVGILKAIRHPNALLFMGVAHSEDHFCIVTELAPRGNLLDLLRDQSVHLEWSTRVRFAQEVVAALAYLHSKGISHRDMKSENVLMFSGDNAGYLCKVADFGLSFLEEAGKKASARLNGSLAVPKPLLRRRSFHLMPNAALTKSKVGTYYTRAPEVDLSAEYDPVGVDTFSTGIVICEIVARNVGEDIRETMTYQKKDPVTGKSLIAFGVKSSQLVDILAPYKAPAALVDIAIACCQEDPSKRPSLQAVHARLESIYSGLLAVESAAKEIQQLERRTKDTRHRAEAKLKSKSGAGLWMHMVSQSLSAAQLRTASLPALSSTPTSSSSSSSASTPTTASASTAPRGAQARAGSGGGQVKSVESSESLTDKKSLCVPVTQLGQLIVTHMRTLTPKCRVDGASMWALISASWDGPRCSGGGGDACDAVTASTSSASSPKASAHVSLSSFVSLWNVLEPIWVLLYEHPQLSVMWSKGLWNPFVSRVEAENALRSTPQSCVLRYSPNRLNLTLSYQKGKRMAHTSVSISQSHVMCGNVSDAKLFRGILEFIGYLQSHHFTTLAITGSQLDDVKHLLPLDPASDMPYEGVNSIIDDSDSDSDSDSDNQ